MKLSSLNYRQILLSSFSECSALPLLFYFAGFSHNSFFFYHPSPSAFPPYLITHSTTSHIKNAIGHVHYYLINPLSFQREAQIQLLLFKSIAVTSNCHICSLLKCASFCNTQALHNLCIHTYKHTHIHLMTHYSYRDFSLTYIHLASFSLA